MYQEYLNEYKGFYVLMECWVQFLQLFLNVYPQTKSKIELQLLYPVKIYLNILMEYYLKI